MTADEWMQARGQPVSATKLGREKCKWQFRVQARLLIFFRSLPCAWFLRPQMHGHKELVVWFRVLSEVAPRPQGMSCVRTGRWHMCRRRNVSDILCACCVLLQPCSSNITSCTPHTKSRQDGGHETLRGCSALCARTGGAPVVRRGAARDIDAPLHLGVKRLRVWNWGGGGSKKKVS